MVEPPLDPAKPSTTGRASGARPVVPTSLLARFADAEGQLIMERRDRARRRLVSVEDAAVAAGTWWLAGGAPPVARLDALLAEAETRSEVAVAAALAGEFPPSPADRPWIATFVAWRLLVGRGLRTLRLAAASALGEHLEGAVPDGEETDPAPPPDSSHAAPLVVRCSNEPDRVDLSPLPALARLIASRTWQLVRFPSSVLLTGDSPAAVWRRAGAPTPGGPAPGLADVDEVRLPLGPRHALVVARVARLGEVVRDLDGRHAAALNRTVAEAAREWVFYHPDADPLREVELAPP